MRDAIIIGAGPAGLSAARTLRAAGVDCVVLEATERAGGRIESFGGRPGTKPAELGAQILHCAPGQFADWFPDLDVALVEPPTPTVIRTTTPSGPVDGLPHVGYLAKALYSSSAGHTVAEALDVHCPAMWRSAALTWLEQTSGQRCEDMLCRSVIDNPLFGLAHRNMSTPVHGMEALVAALADTVDVRFDHRATRIDAVGSAKDVTVSTVDGSTTFRAPHVVLAVPPHVLRSGLHVTDEVSASAIHPAFTPTHAAVAVVHLAAPVSATGFVADTSPSGSLISYEAGADRVSVVAKGAAAQHVAALGTSTEAWQQALASLMPEPTDVVEVRVRLWGFTPDCPGGFPHVGPALDDALQDLRNALPGGIYLTYGGHEISGGAPYVHGAIASGRDAAHHIIACMTPTHRGDRHDTVRA